MMIILVISITLYMTGFYNCLFMTRKNIISFLVASEIMFLGIDLLFIVSSLLFNIANGLIFGVLILMISVGESALGLGLCIASLKFTKDVGFYRHSSLRS